MCGRITDPSDLNANARDFDADIEPLAADEWLPSYSNAPTQPPQVLGLRDDCRVVRDVHSLCLRRRCSHREMHRGRRRVDQARSQHGPWYALPTSLISPSAHTSTA
jgi:hypothetical protein